MSYYLRYLALFFLMFGWSQLEAQMKEDLKKEIDKIIYYDTEILSKNIPGFSVGVIYKDSVFTFHYHAESTSPVNKLDDKSIFELGGLSKVFTAALIERLVQEELLDYQAPLNLYLDSTYINPHLQNLTIVDLVSHQSGLPKLPFEFGTKEKETGNPYAHYTKSDLLEFYKDFVPDEDSNTNYFYSKTNYALLEIAIEKVTKQDYEQVLKQKIFNPLDMNHSYIHNEVNTGQIPAPGFNISGNKVKPFVFQSFAASEGIKSNLHDLLIFLKTNLNEAHPELASIFQNIQQPVAETKLNKNAKVAKGWHVVSFKKYYNAILHSGSTDGHRAFISFVKETGTGVIVLSNSEVGIDGLGFLILRMLNHNWKKKRK